MARRSESSMKKRYWACMALTVILVGGIAVSQGAMCRVLQGYAQPPRPPFDWDITPEELEALRALIPVFFTVKAVVDTLNSVLILGIVMIHLNLYRRTGTKFSLGLVIFSTALLLYTISANPLLHTLFGFSRIGIGPMLIIPDLLTLIASAILLYLSRQ